MNRQDSRIYIRRGTSVPTIPSTGTTTDINYDFTVGGWIDSDIAIGDVPVAFVVCPQAKE